MSDPQIALNLLPKPDVRPSTDPDVYQGADRRRSDAGFPIEQYLPEIT